MSKDLADGPRAAPWLTHVHGDAIFTLGTCMPTAQRGLLGCATESNDSMCSIFLTLIKLLHKAWTL